MTAAHSVPNVHMTTAPSSVSANHLLSQKSGDHKLAANIQHAAIVILPTDLGSEYDEDAFSIHTMDVFDRLSNALVDEKRVAVAATDESYREVDFRSEDLFLPILYVVDPVVAELAVRTLIAFVSDHFSMPGRSLSRSTVKSELHVTSADGSILYHKFDGPAEIYESTIPAVLSDASRRNDSKHTRPAGRD